MGKWKIRYLGLGLGGLALAGFSLHGCLPLLQQVDATSKDELKTDSHSTTISGKIILPSTTNRILAGIKEPNAKINDFSSMRVALAQEGTKIREGSPSPTGEFVFQGVPVGGNFKITFRSNHLELFHFSQIKTVANQSLLLDVDLDSTTRCLLYEKCRPKFPTLLLRDIPASLVASMSLRLEAAVASTSFNFQNPTQSFLEIPWVQRAMNKTASDLLIYLKKIDYGQR